jgi:CheY-like chemotaxis protein
MSKLNKLGMIKSLPRANKNNNAGLRQSNVLLSEVTYRELALMDDRLPGMDGLEPSKGSRHSSKVKRA